MQRDKINPIIRIFHSHPELAKTVKVKTCFLTDQQVAELFSNPKNEPAPMKNKDIRQWKSYPPPHLNLVFRIEERGGMFMGTLQYNVNDGEVIGTIDVQDIGIVGSEKDDFVTFIIPMGGTAISLGRDPEEYPKITYKWKSIYACW